MALKERAAAALRRLDPGDVLPRVPALPGASVLIPLLERDGALRVLVTVRAAHLKHHAGEVCFPGGKSEPGDRDETETALREAREEIGLTSDAVDVICRLYPVLNKAGLLITPVVGFIDGSFTASPNTDEVCEVFTVPLEFFLSEEHHSLLPGASVFGPIHSFTYTEPGGGVHQIWGLTAALALTVAAVALGRKPEFELSFSLEEPLSVFRERLKLTLSRL